MRIATGRELRAAYDRIGFCYMCGEALAGRETNDDHVVAKSLARPEHRSSPLILPVHVECNTAASVQDGHAAELVGFLHGKVPHEKRRQLKYVSERPVESRQAMAAVTGIDLDSLVMRWLQGFHAALYGEFLPSRPYTKLSYSGPFPTGTFDTATNRGSIAPSRTVHQPIVGVIRLNRLCQRLDGISIYDGKCRFECVWSSLDNGVPCCIFALDLYDWKRLGRTPITPEHGCVGLYCPPNGRPQNGAKETRLDGGPLALAGLDPFADVGEGR